jgi:hypothetical protein
VANFYLYADESGKFNRKSEYTSFCGFIAPDLEWWRFGQDWDHCRFSWGVPAVHMAEISDPDRKPDSEWAKVKKALGGSKAGHANGVRKGNQNGEPSMRRLHRGCGILRKDA